jgi:hypothetical protein
MLKQRAIDHMLKSQRGQAILQRYATRLAREASKEMDIILQKMEQLLNKA